MAFHSCFLMEITKLSSGYTLCETVSNYFFGWAVLKHDHFITNQISNKMIFDICVFRLSVILCILAIAIHFLP